MLILVSKPKITPVGTDRFNVSYRGNKGQVWKCSRSTGHQSWRGVIFGRTNTRRPMCGWTGENAFEQLVEMLDEQADCEETLVQADMDEQAGGRDRIRLLGGTAALVIYDEALVQVRNFDVDGITTVLGMMKAAQSRKPLKPVTVEVSRGWDKDTKLTLTIVQGFSIMFKDGPTYYIGRRAEHGSYNLHYFGTIESITAKTVTIGRDGRESSRRLKLAEFAWRNEATPASKAASNAETMMSI